MAIQVRCPNDACHKLLAVSEDYAGKTGKCPSCGATMPIPHPELANGEETPPPPQEGPAVVCAEEPGESRPQNGDDFEGRPRRRRRLADAATADLRNPSPVIATRVCLALGVGLLGFMALVPLFSMYRLQPPEGSEAPVIAGMIRLPEGQVILGVTAAVAALCLTSLVLCRRPAERVPDRFIALTGCLAGGWGIALACWLIGFVWDMYALNGLLNDPNRLDRPLGPMSPGLGLWLGLGLAMAVVVVFAMLLAIRGRALWLYAGEILGLGAGVVLVVFNVVPWDTGPARTTMEAIGKPSLVLETKFARRYWPLHANFDQAKRRLEEAQQRKRAGMNPKLGPPQ